MGAHAVLSPSAAHRWMRCPASLLGGGEEGGAPSMYSVEGTLAHEMGEAALASGQSAHEVWAGVEYITRDGHRIAITDDFRRNVQTYVAYVNDLPGAKMYEQRLKLEWIHPDLWGTGDALAIDVIEQHVHVVDLKFGRGIKVEADDNEQLRIYALGALGKHNLFDAEEVTVHIVQPRLDHIVRRTYKVENLYAWAASTLHGAALRGIDVLRAARDMEPIPAEAWQAGEHCKFCPHAAHCTALRDHAMAAAVEAFTEVKTEQTNEDLARWLADADVIDIWIGAVREEGEKRAMRGETIPGFKLVHKRSTRAWLESMDPVLLVKRIEHYTPAYQEPSLKTPAMVEKDLGKKKFSEALTDIVVTKSPGLTLVREGDRRPAVNPAQAMFSTATEES